MTRKTIGALCLAMILAASGPAGAQDRPTLRLGLLKFGTVNWEAQTIIDEGLDERHGFELRIVSFAGGDATKVAMQAGDIDVTTGDWLFVSRQRAEGAPLTFVPYSSSIGAVMAPCESDIASIEDLRSKRLGVAGGPLDKSWLMLLALAERRHGIDLARETSPVYGAPPLLAEKLRQGELGAGLNYWHYNARLETEGFCEIVSAQEAARELGARGDISAVGYIFDEGWAQENRDLALGFVAASREAKAVLAGSDAAWQRIRPIMGAENDAVFEALVRRYREGIPDRPVEEEEADTRAVYRHLAEIGGEKLVGVAQEMTPGTFWQALKDGS
ncbi:ABC transporter substrate-binding protein [Lutibaculum baratangense]|uniref:ABC transporter substrate-binding protein n=1 Tax=Lutibaculum baratangense AMV1 TaxID=631454 RepID=V4RI40_9HYPH|nr:ABC transporter substrate-binding protein [Lutibaculum baratangense]ESR25806.1 ABC transporter substrate-binding protein [Lutibaculum baratangense AMV1]